MARKGILLAGGTATRLFPLTVSVSKQLMPVYDKPMIYYSLSVLMLAGIREILIITTPEDLNLYRRLLGDGAHLGVQLQYVEQPFPEGIAQAFILGASFLGQSPSCLLLGDNFFYGQNFQQILQRTSENTTGAIIFGHHVSHPTSYGVVELAADGKIISLEEKPVTPKSNYAVPGIYFYDNQAVEYVKNLKPSARGELEITCLNRLYLCADQLKVQLLDNTTQWFDMGTHLSLLEAGKFVQETEQELGVKIACIEEIAYQKGWIDKPQFQANVSRIWGNSAYADYLRKIL